MNLIETRDMSIHFGEEVVLENVNFSISPGEIVTLVGPNGSGKSTLVRALLGVVPLSNGSVIKREGLRVGYVPQKLMIDKTMPLSVARFLALPGRKTTRETDAAMTRVGIVGLQDRQMAELSGGQFQRVLLARALLARPEILILDEPTQGLDQPGVAAFYRIIEEVRQDLGCAILLVSHDLHVVMSASDRVICLNGHVCCEGSPQVVSAAPEYRALFGVGTGGTLALYRHEHDHDHEHEHGHEHGHGHAHQEAE